MRFLPLILLASCATIKPGFIDDSDIQCGSGVRLRKWSGTSCETALSFINSAGGNHGWTILVTGGYPGMAVDKNLHAVEPDAVTYPKTRVIEVRSMRLYTLWHEFGHAYDLDHGLPNHRD